MQFDSIHRRALEYDKQRQTERMLRQHRRSLNTKFRRERATRLRRFTCVGPVDFQLMQFTGIVAKHSFHFKQSLSDCACAAPK